MFYLIQTSFWYYADRYLKLQKALNKMNRKTIIKT